MENEKENTDDIIGQTNSTVINISVTPENEDDFSATTNYRAKLEKFLNIRDGHIFGKLQYYSPESPVSCFSCLITLSTILIFLTMGIAYTYNYDPKSQTLGFMIPWYILRITQSIFSIINSLVIYNYSNDDQSRQMAKQTLLDYCLIPLINFLYFSMSLKDLRTFEGTVKLTIIGGMISALYFLNFIIFFSQRESLLLKYVIIIQLVLEIQIFIINLKFKNLVESWMTALIPLDILLFGGLFALVVYMIKTKIDLMKALFLLIGLVNIYLMVQVVYVVDDFFKKGKEKLTMMKSPSFLILTVVYGSALIYKEHKKAKEKAYGEISLVLSRTRTANTNNGQEEHEPLKEEKIKAALKVIVKKVKK